MNKLARRTRWYTPWLRRAHVQDDPADLGTAFGLDLSMQHSAARDASVHKTTREGWMQRWAAKRRVTR